MKFLQRLGYWLIGDRNQSQYIKADPSSRYGSSPPIKGGIVSDAANGLNFTVYPATGGKVIQFSWFDQEKDRTRTHLYVVTEKDDLGKELDLIITKESLSR